MKKILIGLLILGSLFFLVPFFLEDYFESRISQAINTNSDRSYDILFEDISISLFRREASLKKIRLVSLKDSEAIKVSGSLQSIELSGIDFFDLLLNRRLSIYRLVLVDPGFKLTRKDIQGRPEDNSKALQEVFKDIISRGLIQNFELVNGTAEFFVERDSLVRFAQFTDLNILANGIVSDSVIVQNPVPFQLESIQMSLKNLNVITGVNQAFKLGELRFDSKTESILISEISLAYDDWEEAANSSIYQQDVLELTIEELSLNYLNAKNNISGDWQIVAGLAEFRGLSLDDYRDKNKSRPEEPEKPLFEGLIEKIPFPIELDTIRILDSKLVYREFLPGKSKPGVLSFENLSAEILNVISTDSLQGDSEMEITANTLFNGVAEIDLRIQVPYGKNSFSLQAKIDEFELSEINTVLEQMANVRVESGKLLTLQLQMEASRYASSNQLIFQYENLKLKILDEEKSVNKLKSSLANIFTSKNNLPSDPKYKTATYRSERNIYRGPFNLLWQSTKEGLVQIVPGDVAQLFLDK